MDDLEQAVAEALRVTRSNQEHGSLGDGDIIPVDSDVEGMVPILWWSAGELHAAWLDETDPDNVPMPPSKAGYSAPIRTFSPGRAASALRR